MLILDSHWVLSGDSAEEALRRQGYYAHIYRTDKLGRRWALMVLPRSDKGTD